ncbi:hypothetical protein [Streptomyces pinistramenti]|uniref:hypothetical protein n=1 Tax=Streptomyces pinistramenti TaxID=2884812 RepID=UPI001D08920D|nr:hypothetical protein [Streptomyces pinistramenti]MCB5909259.1 hypothetical protein [Streptomyces pinistramenti]
MNDRIPRPHKLSTTPARLLRKRRRTMERTRPLWHDLLRGAAYAAGGSIVTLLTSWMQTWH